MLQITTLWWTNFWRGADTCGWSSCNWPHKLVKCLWAV